MSKFIFYDKYSNYFWVNNIHYGYDFKNKAIFKAKFVSNSFKAIQLDKECAEKVLYRFQCEKHIIAGSLKVFTCELKMIPV